MKAVRSLLALLEVEHPFIQAPMSGGITSATLVAGTSRAGALGFIGASQMSPEQIADTARDVRERTERPFGINLFVPIAEQPTVNSSRMLELLSRHHEALGLPPPTPPLGESIDFDAQVEAVLESGASVFSFTFGIPHPPTLERIKGRGLRVLGSATTVREARMLEAAGVDAIVAQGSEAGGHRATFAGPFERAAVGTLALVPQIVDAVSVPVVAAGGIMDGRGIVAALALGAGGVQMGTAFLRCSEAGSSPAYREALRHATDDATLLTRAFSGRPARSLANTFIEEMAFHENALLPYPLQAIATRPMLRAAAEQGDARLLPLWAGQAAALGRETSVEELVGRLVLEVEQVRRELAQSPTG